MPYPYIIHGHARTCSLSEREVYAMLETENARYLKRCNVCCCLATQHHHHRTTAQGATGESQQAAVNWNDVQKIIIINGHLNIIHL